MNVNRNATPSNPKGRIRLGTQFATRLVADRFVCMAILTAALTLPSPAKASSVSLLNEVDWVECRPVSRGVGFDRMDLDPKDTLAEVYSGKKMKERYRTSKFLDTAILLKGEGADVTGKHALFQILPDGDAVWLVGELKTLSEKECDDTGASKTCKNDLVKRLFWSSEKLEAEFDGVKYSGPVTTYGFLANKATYFRSAAGKETAVLLDYGAPLNLLIGREHKLNCKHVKRAKTSP